MFVRKSKYKKVLLDLDETVFLLEITTAMLNDLNKKEAKKRHPSTSSKKTTPKRKVVKEL
jgi:hypothetical protein